jgi:dCMP deaminase
MELIQQNKWDLRFLGLAREISTWSKDPSKGVGSVIVNDDKVIVGMGYNGFPRGVHDLKERYEDREVKYKLITHAEANAVIAAGHAARGCTIYVYPTFMTPAACNDCCKLIIQSGIKAIVGIKEKVDEAATLRWEAQSVSARLMCMEAGVTWRAAQA